MRQFTIIIIAFFSFQTAYMQEDNNEQLIQITGRVLNEFLQPLRFAHIVNISSGKGAITDREGKFSFIAIENDTIIFSTLGYKKSKVIIPNDLEEPFLIRDVLLASDTIMIAEIEVYPWHDYEDFKEAFINLELPEDDLDRARKNIALIKTQLIMENNPSPSLNFNQVMQEQFDKTAVRGTHPTYDIFNVFAWGKFFEAIKNGDFKNDNK